MADTFDSRLKLRLQESGANSGQWGTLLNQTVTNIASVFGFGTHQLTSDADATLTLSDDGASIDVLKSSYLKITSSVSLTATRTLTFAPNTLNQVKYIENATTGSQSLVIKQGSGATVTVASGKTAVLYFTGSGSDAAVVDALAGVDPGVTDTLAEVLAAGNATGGTDIVMSAGDNITNASGDLTIDVAGDIILDADGGEVFLKDGGTSTGKIRMNDGDLQIRSLISDKDITLEGSDGGSIFEAMRLDMSAAGAATFNAGATFNSEVTMTRADNGVQLTLQSTDTDANAGPNLKLERAVTGADSDLLGTVIYHGRDDAGNGEDYARTLAFIRDASNGSEDGAFQIAHLVNGTERVALEIDNDEYVFNNAGIDIDFRVESNGNANMLFVDAGNDRVGIGATPINSALYVGKGGGFAGQLLVEGGSGSAYVGIGHGTDDAAIHFKTGDLRFATTTDTDLSGFSEKMRITNGGNLIVSGTAAGQATSVALHNTGYLHAVSSHQMAAIFDRRDSDGDVLLLRKEGSAVGSIGSRGGVVSHFILDPRSGGAGITAAGTSVFPTTHDGTISDGAIDLGYNDGSSTYRWKDLYLSGGVFLGGTAAANKLDDAEEGSWTPNFNSFTGSFAAQIGRYVKVGNLVTASFHLDINVAGGTVALVVTGLPFTSISVSANYGGVTGLHCNGWATTTKPDNGLVSPNGNSLALYRSEGQLSTITPTLTDMGGGNVLAVVVYHSA